MKIQTSSREISRTFKILSKVIQSKNAAPILGNILISQQDDGTFRLIGGSGESILSLPAEISVIDGNKIPLMAINPKKLLSVVDAMPETILTITITPGKEGGMLTFTHIAGEFSIPYSDGSEYPIFSPSDENICTIHLPASILLPSVEQARTFTAGDELRPVFNAVLLDVTPDECIIVATDGRRLYRRIYGNGSHGNGTPFFVSGGKTKMLFPSHLLSAFSAFAKTEDINIATDGKMIRVWSDGVEYVLRTIEGNYPNYNSVIPPMTAAQTMDVPAQALLSAIRRVTPFAPESSQLLRISVTDGQACLSAQNIDFSTSASERIDVTSNNVADITIGANSSIFSQCLRAVEAEDVRLYFTSPTMPIIVTSADANPDTLALLMPMQLDF